MDYINVNRVSNLCICTGGINLQDTLVFLTILIDEFSSIRIFRL